MIMIAGLVSVPQVVHAALPSYPDEEPSSDGVVRCMGSYNQYHCIDDPSFDGFGTCTGSSNAYQYCTSQSLTTSKEEDVVILVVQCRCQSDTPSIIDSAVLNYTLRGSYTTPQAPGIFPITLWEYYATAESPLTSDNITVVLPPPILPIHVFAIHPGDTETIFDANPSLPVTLTCPGLAPGGGYQDCSASAGPLADDFVIAITAINDADPCPATSGFSELVFDGNLDIDYRILGESQSDFTFTCIGGNAPGTDPMAIVIDAISLQSDEGAC
jgi:hypothetical protein